MKLVHAADLHLDSPLTGLEAYEGAPVEAIRSATRRAFQNLVSLCLEEEVALLLLAGDIYDGNWKDYSTGLFFAAELSRLATAGIDVVMVRGNHDAASNITRHLSLPKHVIELSTTRAETRVFEDRGVAVHGQSFRDRSVQVDLAANYPAPVPGLFNVGLLHTSLTGREGHHDYAPCSLETLRARGYDYWALGHVHRREIVSEAPYIVYPGNLQGRHHQETGPKGATVITVSDGRVASVEARVLDVFRFGSADVDVTDAASPDDVVDLARAALDREVAEAEGRPLGARVILRGATRAHAALFAEPERWENQIRLEATAEHGAELWIERVRFATSLPLAAGDLEARDDAVGQVIRAIRASRNETGDERLVRIFDELKKKLPLEVRDGPDPILLDDPRFIEALFDDVERMLVPGLASAGADE
ncbi:MAG TPA: DNA repair exonuclease [Polyangiaceae bacterium]|nr:DNA repair exonuclease [Polyangiaceae bacterium]